jgi:DNA-directed RNA polymerase beta subunit
MNYEMRSAEAVSSFSGHYQSSSNADEVLTAPPAPKKRRVKVKVVEPETKVIEHIETNEAAAEIKKLIQYEEDVQKKVEAAIRDTSEEEKVLLDHIGSFVEEPYHIIESYFAGQHLERLVRHQIESYNHFVNYQIQRTIQMFNPVTIRSENDYVADIDKYFLEIQVAFSNFKLYPPQIHENNGATKMMLPQEAKLRNFTYASTMNVDINIKYIVRTSENMETPRIIEKTLPKINIGKLPIMLKSSICVLSQNKHISNDYTGECSMDSGGYFIIKGSEKTVLGQERAAENRVYCFDGKNTTKWSWFAEIKSVPDFKCISPKQIEMMVASKNNGFGHGIFITVPRIKNPIELYVLFRALGIISDKDITKYIMLDIGDEKKGDVLQFLQASIIDANKYMTQEDALRHITASVAYTPLNLDKEVGARKKREFTVDVLDNDLFPHCQTLQQKLYMVGYMANKLIQTSLGWLPPDDRDSYLNKRIELTGTLLNNLFRNYFNKLVKEMQKQVVREINNGSWRSTDDYESIINMTNIYKIMKSTTIENGINRALSTGDFSIKQSNSSKVGVAQVLNRLTYVSSLSHLRRINTPLEKSGELIAPRKLHGTTLGFLCCLTGDAEILLSNRLDTCPIRDIRDGDCVNTVHRSTLADEPSDMKNFFCKTPDKLYEITTISGRTIKATGDHPFLINMGSGFEMVPVSRLHIGDKMVIRHTVKALLDEATTPLNTMDKPIPIQTFKLIARIFGYMFGHVSDTVSFGEECDAVQFVEDLEALGFERVQVEASSTNWTVQLSQGVQEFITNIWDPEVDSHLPEWLIDAEPSVKREFLSGFQGRNGSVIMYENDKRIRLNSTFRATRPNELNRLVKMMVQISELFFDLNIHGCVNYVDTSNNAIHLMFDRHLDNIARYANTIGYTYCDKKRRDSALAIETVLCLSSGRIIPLEHLIEPLTHGCNTGCVSVPILSIREVPVEPVYDFTTYSDNHSFVASSFVSSNCAETPEGQSIGIVKNISYMAHITIPTNSASLYEFVTPHVLSVNDTPPEELNDKVKVFVNGCWLGVTEDPEKLYQEMKDKKYRGIINIYTSIIFDIKMMEIRICNDGGRLTRPLLRVRDNQALITKDIIERLTRHELTWNDLLTNCRLEESVVEYIDPDEQNLAMIAMKCKDTYLHCMTGQRYRFTHCEIHPSTIFGVVASCVPYPDHNQAPRNTYQCAMGKQAMGVYATNYDQRMDKTAYILNYPSRPLVETRIMNIIRLNQIPSGCQIHVAIMTHTGYNQEDSVLINKGSIDRGLFMATIYHTEKDEDKNIIRDEIIRCKPDPTKTKGIKFGNYDKLNSQGFIPENSLVENRDVIIAKTIPIKENRNDPTKTVKYEDQSKTFRTTEETYIDKNFTGRNGDGYNFAKVRVRTLRKPVLGDKFSSRHGKSIIAIC